MLSDPMTVKKLFVVLWVLVLATASSRVRAQSCSVLGQTPATAFPVCGSNVFVQDSVPECDNGSLVVPNCAVGPGQPSYSALNPYWYKFTCFSSGTLGLLISPNNAGDDYDWQLYDVTGQPLNAIYTNVSLVIAADWSGVTGNTGTSSTASNLIECGSTATSSPPPFSKMPNLIQGHNYLLLISHFSGSGQSGYQLSFGGGTASITDTTQPAVAKVNAICQSLLGVTLNKKMACSSLTATGSEFAITPAIPGVQIIGAVTNTCNTGFDMDSITLTLSGNLPTGIYSLAVQTGSDGNTLLDICSTPIPVGQSVQFAVLPPQPTPVAGLAPPGCSPDFVKVIFNGPTPIRCSSIAADGSDFSLAGSTPVSVVGASAICDSLGMTDTVVVQLSAAIKTMGSYQLSLKTGDDGNTLLNYCGISTAAITVPFNTADTVSAAAYNVKVLYGCTQDTVIYSYPTIDEINQWQWLMDGTNQSRLQDPPRRIYGANGTETVSLSVSNGVCSDSASGVVTLDNFSKTQFEAPMIICPKDYATLINNSSGNWIMTWNWTFGDGTTSDQKDPADHLFPPTGEETKYTVVLVTTDSIGCTDTAKQVIDVLKSCYIAVPGAFTPNGDGVNDYLYPLNALKAENLQFRVYNRWGQMVFETTDWLKRWDGTIGGHPAPAGAYAWTLSYVDGETGKRIVQKGTSILIR
ncbi:MAG TPA: gliding motility-associated C-terminal domain-containing protein [Puia sp.]|nr:gliding motility-associated C-terminal domain-containing protein [Puia sp.]